MKRGKKEENQDARGCERPGRAELLLGAVLDGRLAFRLDGPGQTRPIRAFDATAPEILLVPAIQGG